MISFNPSFRAIRRMLTLPPLRQFSSAEAMRQKYIDRGAWGEKESMDWYLRRALDISRKFVSSVALSSEEKVEFQKIKDWYRYQYVTQPTTLLPFIPLEAIGKTFEEASGHFLTKDEISFYLQYGFIGPVPIHSLTQKELKAIADRFPNFNRNYFKNLGSLYSALRNKCLFDLATNREILTKVSSILGENIQLSNMTVHEIGAGSGKSSNETNGMVDAFNCHSDLSSGSHYYFRPEANQVENLALDNRGVCVWVSISGTNPNNSPLYLFPRTHLWEITTPFTHIENAKRDPARLEHVFKLLAFNHKNPARRIGLCSLEYEYLLSSQYRSLLPTILKTETYAPAGSAILFNQHTRHGSGFNASRNARLAISLRFNTAFKKVGGTEWAGAVTSRKEREQLGLLNDPRVPMIQLLGTQHHPENVPLDLERLSKETY